jgi:hypothetical protein
MLPKAFLVCFDEALRVPEMILGLFSLLKVLLLRELEQVLEQLLEHAGDCEGSKTNIACEGR